MTTADYIKIAIYLIAALGVGLPILAKQSFIAKSAARTKLVQLAEEIVSQIEATLQADPSASLTTLIYQGVDEMKTTANDEIATLGIPPAALDSELALLLQRYGSRLPGIAGKIAAIAASDLGASTVSGASGVVALRRGPGFIRSVGAV